MSTVTTRALIQRINRRLARNYQALRKTRLGARGWSELGEYYVIDTWKNTVVYVNTDPLTEAKELGCLGSNEIVQSAS